MAERLGELLVQLGAVRPEDVGRALRVAQERGVRLGEALVGMGLIDEDTLLKALARQKRVPFAEARWFEALEPRILRMVSRGKAARLRVIPLRLMDKKLVLATCEADHLDRSQELASQLGHPIKPVLARRADIERALGRYYGDEGASGEMMVADDVQLLVKKKDPGRQTSSRLSATPGPGSSLSPPPSGQVAVPRGMSLPPATTPGDGLISAEQDAELRELFASEDEPSAVSRTSDVMVMEESDDDAEERTNVSVPAFPEEQATQMDMRAPLPTMSMNRTLVRPGVSTPPAPPPPPPVAPPTPVSRPPPVPERSNPALRSPPPRAPDRPASAVRLAPIKDARPESPRLSTGSSARLAPIKDRPSTPPPPPPAPPPEDMAPPPAPVGAEGEVSEKFGPYQLMRRIKSGGMAEVYLAKTGGVEGFEKQVAIKRILPHLTESGEFVDMFIDEAKLTVQLNHANIAHIYDFGKRDNTYYIAMEFIHGKDVNALFREAYRRRQPLPVSICCFIVQQICEGLDYAHRKKGQDMRDLGIVHRDISPANVLVSFEGAVKIIDFGIAKAVSKLSMTRPGLIKGKISYMSPEQMRGQAIDRRSDIFALGIILYELLAGRRLFAAKTDVDTIRNVIKGNIPPLQSVRPEVADELSGIVMKALQREPEQRYPWASEMSVDLQAFMLKNGMKDARGDLVRYMNEVMMTAE